ncbi:kinase-like domain-containing protein [Mycotypha africana]|uniref:kinase-like domain-containing protein n=1 Tax=Mycotypha africana TaxID=64632 RepID=UPI00230142DC|nr:kinase-like domain-containing protein [Mycotypha africana]KAI8973226.1 kinase-like domain-containing protein [Mycotypha africana]
MSTKEHDIYQLKKKLEDINLSSSSPAELPSGIGNSLLKFRLHQQEIDSNPPSNYNSDTDEPTPRKRHEHEKIKQEVLLDQDYTVSTKERRVNRDDFQTICVLGRGAFGKVYLVKHKKSSELYAMKVLKKASLVVHGRQAIQAKTERQILEEVRHPFIVKLCYAFQTPIELHMILDYAVGGELFRHLDHEGMFEEPMAIFYAAELVSALDHLHSLGIVYRDLKPENCLLDLEGHVVLTDFGLSKVAIDGKTNTICGTAEYMAPEILMGLEYDITVDWWSLGILLYDMLTGSPPFNSNNRQKTIDSILSKKIPMPYYLTPDAKDILSKLLRKNPNARLGAKPKRVDAIRRHRFFRSIDWDALERRELTPPIIPIVTDPEAAEVWACNLINRKVCVSWLMLLSIPCRTSTPYSLLSW